MYIFLKSSYCNRALNMFNNYSKKIVEYKSFKLCLVDHNLVHKFGFKGFFFLLFFLKHFSINKYNYLSYNILIILSWSIVYTYMVMVKIFVSDIMQQTMQWNSREFFNLYKML